MFALAIRYTHGHGDTVPLRPGSAAETQALFEVWSEARGCHRFLAHWALDQLAVGIVVVNFLPVNIESSLGHYER